MNKIHSLHKLDYFTPFKRDAIILDVSNSSKLVLIVEYFYGIIYLDNTFFEMFI